MEECKGCGRSFDELYQEKITLDSDGICDECGPKLEEMWQKENAALEREYRRERL